MTQPEKKKAFLSNLITLCGALGLLVVSAFTVLYANAAPGGTTYTGYDDNTEVVNRVNFVQSGDQSSAGEVSNIYAKDDSTLVVEIDQIVSDKSNVLADGVNSQILGGEGINVGSENIAIIGGGGNKVVEGYDNATVLGGSGNLLTGTSDGSTPSVLVGGAGNKVSDGKGGLVVVGGKGNTIVGGSDSQILGGENNTLTGTKNALVAGSNVSNSGVDNSFVFSDGGSVFSPETSGAFYINAELGLGLGGNASGGVASAGGVSVGEINILSNDCISDNIGIQGVYNGCLFGCTTGSAANGGKWDLLETSSECVEWCDNSVTGDVHNRCVDTIKTLYTGFDAICNTASLGDLEDEAVPCPGVAELLAGFKDAVFDIDFVDECPYNVNKLANPCVYKCNDGYSAGGDGCKKECTLPWDSSRAIQHGEFVTGYMLTGTTCTSTGTSCNLWMARLKCDNGELKQLNGAAADVYKYESCSLSAGNACPSDFNLSETDLISGGVYSGCVEYRTEGNSVCEAINKYMFSGCSAGYTVVGTNECSLGCTVPWSTTGWTIPVGESVTGYRQGAISCNVGGTGTSCELWSQKLVCGADGNLSNYSNFSNSGCVVTAVTGNSTWFNLRDCPKASTGDGTVVAGKILAGTPIGYCEVNTGYTVESGKSCKLDLRYHLTGCIEGYYKSGDTCLPRCILPWTTTSLEYNANSTDKVNTAAWEANSIIYRATVKGYATTGQQCPTPTASGTNFLMGCEATTNWKTMTCGTGGVLDGATTYKYQTCISSPVPNKTGFNRTAPVANAVCESWQPFSTGNNICVRDAMTYKCTECKPGFTLNGKDLVGGDPDALCLGDCKFNSSTGEVILNGYTGRTYAYNASSYTCPTEYTANTSREKWTCYSGTITRSLGLIALDGRPYISRPTQTTNACATISDTTQQGTRTKVINGTGAHGIANTENAQSPCITYQTGYEPSKPCTVVNTSYYLKCKADSNTSDLDGDNSYVWNSNSTACVRCESSVPTNAHRNNATFPTSSTNFHYTTNTSEVCGFSCDDGFYWSGGQCVSYYCEFADGATPVIHNGKTTVYHPSANPVCNTTCEAINVQCRYGKWMKLNGTTLTSEEVTNAFKNCATVAGYVMNGAGSPTAGTCAQTNNGTIKTLTSRPSNTTLISTCTQYSPNGFGCTKTSDYYTVDCPSATSYWTGNLCQKYCVWNGTNYKSGQTVVGYSNKSPTCGTDCNAVKTTKTCGADGNWSNSTYNQTGCAVVASNGTCDSTFNLSSKGDSNGVYSTCTGYTANGQSCVAYNKYKITGCSAGYTLYNGACYKKCTLDGKTIDYNATGVWYTASRNCQYYGGCDSVKQTLKCTGSDKTNTYLVVNGTSTKVTSAYASCSNSCDDCNGTVWGNVSHLGTVTAYNNSSVNCSSTSTTCTSVSRQCIDGTMQGNSSYNKASCTLNSVDNCAAETSATKKVLGTVSIANSSKSSTCTNAYVGNNPPTNTCTQSTYNYYTCNTNYHWNSGKTACVGDTLSCGTQPANSSIGSSTYTYAGSTKSWSYKSSGTLGECEYRCADGYNWNGSSCVDACAFNGSTYNVGAQITGYSSSSETCPTTCSVVTATCQSNGTWNKTIYSSCTQNSYTPSGYTSSCDSHGSCSTATKYTANNTTKTCSSSTVYKLNSCDTCSSTTYPISGSCPPHGYCSSCTNYSKSSNSCVSSSTVYKLNSCESGWQKSGNTCVESDGCDGPCGSVDDGESLTCYKPTTCSSSSTTSSSQTRSCSNGSWSSSFTSTYTATSPELIPVDCDTTEYPATSTNNRCSSWISCTNYSVSSNSCVAGTTRYRATAAATDYYINSSNSDCVAICNPTSTSSPCNGGYSPSGTQYASTYTCGSSTCTCGANKIWNGSYCKTVSTMCYNDADDHYACYDSNRTSYSSDSGGFYWTCQNGVTSKSCHDCKPGYSRNSSQSKCIEDTPTYSSCTYTEYRPSGDTVVVSQKTIAHGDSVTLYSSATGSPCQSQTRTCNDGTLGGSSSYKYSSCTNYCPASGGCGSTRAGQSCTTYSKIAVSSSDSCSNYSRTSTCNSNGSWSSTPYAYSSCGKCPGEVCNGACCVSCADGYEEVNGSCVPKSCYSSACGTVQHGHSCVTYSQPYTTGSPCSYYSVTSTCNAGSWDVTPKSYSSCGCNSTVCGTVQPGGTCSTYSVGVTPAYNVPCSAYNRTSTCQSDGFWDSTPGSYSSCRLPNDCPASGGCPTTHHNGSCTSYSKTVGSSSSPCSSASRTSTCNDGSWSSTPLSNGSCCDDVCSSSTYLSCPSGMVVKNTAYTNACGNPCYTCEEDCSAPSGYTQGTPPTNDCYNYSTKTVCGVSYYKKGLFQCTINQTCVRGTCTSASATCFVAGTQVTMADGSTENIEDVKIGDKLLGESGINTVLAYDRPVLGNRHLWSINGSDYFVSDEHPFKTIEGWKSFSPEMTKLEIDLDTTQLNVGDVLIMNDGLDVIETVDYIDADYNTPLYNFSLDGDHTYYVNGYLVHNKVAPNACLLCNGYTPGLNEACCTSAAAVSDNYSCKGETYAVLTDNGSSCSCCGTCFPAGTKVTMADGSTKNIEDINTGDVVLSYNTETKSLEPNIAIPIVHVDGTDEMYELTINGDILKVTYTHRFYVVLPSEDDYECGVSYDWVAAKDLNVGDLLFMKDGSYAIISNINHYPNVETVYNLSVNNNHNYFVDKGYLVHNSKQMATDCREYYCASTERDCESAATSNGYTCPSRGACCYDRGDGCWCYK